MNPIVNPWVFYAIDAIASINQAAQMVAVACIIAGGIACVPFLFTLDRTEESYYKGDYICHVRSKRIVKLCAKVGLVALLTAAIIPSDRTMYKMLAASYVTPNNVAAVQGNIVDFIGKIAEAIGKATAEVKK